MSTYAQKQASKRYVAKLHRYQLQFTEQDEALYQHFASIEGPKSAYLKRLIREDMERGVGKTEASDLVNANTKKAIRRAYERGQSWYEDARGRVYRINETDGSVTLWGYCSGETFDEFSPEDTKFLGSCKDW